MTNQLRFDGPGGSQVPQSVLDSMVGYMGVLIPTWVGITSLAKLQSMSCRVRESAQALLNALRLVILSLARTTSLTFQLSRAISREWQKGMRSLSQRLTITRTFQAGNKQQKTKER